MRERDTTEQSEPWVAVVNPCSGKGPRKPAWPPLRALLEQQGIPHQAVFTRYKGHAVALTRDHIAQGCRKFLAVGGDGTLNEVVNGIFTQHAVAPTEVTLGVLPTGTGNDWGRTYGLPRAAAQRVALVKRGRTLVQDAGRIQYRESGDLHTRFFINMAGLGLDGQVALATNALKARGRAGRLVYAACILRSLAVFKAGPARIVVDGTEHRLDLLSAVVGIGQFNGGGMRQAPNALTDDGLFDLTLIGAASKWRVAAHARRLYDGSIGAHERVVCLRGEEILVEPDTPVMLEADGESLGLTPASFTIIPRSVRVIADR